MNEETNSTKCVYKYKHTLTIIGNNVENKRTETGCSLILGLDGLNVEIVLFDILSNFLEVDNVDASIIDMLFDILQIHHVLLDIT